MDVRKRLANYNCLLFKQQLLTGATSQSPGVRRWRGGGVGGWSFCRGQIIYLNPALRRAENCKLYTFTYYKNQIRICLKLFIMKKTPTPPWRLNGGPLIFQIIIAYVSNSLLLFNFKVNSLFCIYRT